MSGVDESFYSGPWGPAEKSADSKEPRSQNVAVPTLPEDVIHEGIATDGAVKDRPGSDTEGAM